MSLRPRSCRGCNISIINKQLRLIVCDPRDPSDNHKYHFSGFVICKNCFFAVIKGENPNNFVYDPAFPALNHHLRNHDWKTFPIVKEPSCS